jgi:uncharacterized protein (TIGR00369 family)
MVDRTRTVSWSDPVATAEAGRRLDGAVFLAAVIAGELPPPPLAALLGFRLVEAADGRAVVEAEPGEHVYNLIGVAHGGFAMALLDTAVACAIISRHDAGTTSTTLELKTNFIRPITAETGTVRAEGRVVHLGGRVATAEGEIRDSRGRLLAHATTTCLVVPVPGG